MAHSPRGKEAFYYAAAALGILLDQAAKAAAVSCLKGKEDVVLLRGVLSLSYTENKGAAFGLMPGGGMLFIGFAVLVTLAAFVYIHRILKTGQDAGICLWLALIGAGAVGNLIDRLFRGFVVDYIWFSLIDFPVFNIADIFIVCSCFVLVLILLTGKDAPGEGGAE